MVRTESPLLNTKGGGKMSILQDDNIYFSIPRQYNLSLEFNSADFERVLNIWDEYQPANEWVSYDMPEDYVGYYTKLVIYTLYEFALEMIIPINVDSIATYSEDMDYSDATSLRSDSGNSLYIALSEDQDKLYVYAKEDIAQGYSLYKVDAIIESQQMTITNENIVKESMSIEDSLCASDFQLRFGACEARCFRITIANIDLPNLQDRWFSAWLETDLEYTLVDSDGNRLVDSDGDYLVARSAGGKYRIPVGKFKVYSDKPRNDRSTRDLICYDAMYDIFKADVLAWYESYAEYHTDVTIKDFRDAFFEHLGIEQDNLPQALPNDNCEFSLTPVHESGFLMTGKMVAERICELNGVFGHIDVWGRFTYIYLHRADYIEYPFYVENSGGYEDYTTDYITGILLLDRNGAVVRTEGTADNAITINQFDEILNFNSQGVVEGLPKILNRIKTISYRPFNIQAYGNPLLPVGTAVTIQTKNKTINSFIMNKTLTGMQNMKDSIEAYGERQLEKSI